MTTRFKVGHTYYSAQTSTQGFYKACVIKRTEDKVWLKLSYEKKIICVKIYQFKGNEIAFFSTWTFNSSQINLVL